jgi:hypothetical protein
LTPKSHSSSYLLSDDKFISESLYLTHEDIAASLFNSAFHRPELRNQFLKLSQEIEPKNQHFDDKNNEKNNVLPKKDKFITLINGIESLNVKHSFLIDIRPVLLPVSSHSHQNSPINSPQNSQNSQKHTHPQSTPLWFCLTCNNCNLPLVLFYSQGSVCLLNPWLLCTENTLDQAILAKKRNYLSPTYNIIVLPTTPQQSLNPFSGPFIPGVTDLDSFSIKMDPMYENIHFSLTKMLETIPAISPHQTIFTPQFPSLPLNINNNHTSDGSLQYMGSGGVVGCPGYGNHRQNNNDKNDQNNNDKNDKNDKMENKCLEKSYENVKPDPLQQQRLLIEESLSIFHLSVQTQRTSSLSLIQQQFRYNLVAQNMFIALAVYESRILLERANANLNYNYCNDDFPMVLHNGDWFDDGGDEDDDEVKGIKKFNFFMKPIPFNLFFQFFVEGEKKEKSGKSGKNGKNNLTSDGGVLFNSLATNSYTTTSANSEDDRFSLNSFHHSEAATVGFDVLNSAGKDGEKNNDKNGKNVFSGGIIVGNENNNMRKNNTILNQIEVTISTLSLNGADGQGIKDRGAYQHNKKLVFKYIIEKDQFFYGKNIDFLIDNHGNHENDQNDQKLRKIIVKIAPTSSIHSMWALNTGLGNSLHNLPNTSLLSTHQPNTITKNEFQISQNSQNPQNPQNFHNNNKLDPKNNVFEQKCSTNSSDSHLIGTTNESPISRLSELPFSTDSTLGELYNVQPSSQPHSTQAHPGGLIQGINSTNKYFFCEKNNDKNNGNNLNKKIKPISPVVTHPNTILQAIQSSNNSSPQTSQSSIHSGHGSIQQQTQNIFVSQTFPTTNSPNSQQNDQNEQQNLFKQNSLEPSSSFTRMQLPSVNLPPNLLNPQYTDNDSDEDGIIVEPLLFGLDKNNSSSDKRNDAEKSAEKNTQNSTRQKTQQNQSTNINNTPNRIRPSQTQSGNEHYSGNAIYTPSTEQRSPFDSNHVSYMSTPGISSHHFTPMGSNATPQFNSSLFGMNGSEKIQEGIFDYDENIQQNINLNQNLLENNAKIGPQFSLKNEKKVNILNNLSNFLPIVNNSDDDDEDEDDYDEDDSDYVVNNDNALLQDADNTQNGQNYINPAQKRPTINNQHINQLNDSVSTNSEPFYNVRDRNNTSVDDFYSFDQTHNTSNQISPHIPLHSQQINMNEVNQLVQAQSSRAILIPKSQQQSQFAQMGTVGARSGSGMYEKKKRIANSQDVGGSMNNNGQNLQNDNFQNDNNFENFVQNKNVQNAFGFVVGSVHDYENIIHSHKMQALMHTARTQGGQQGNKGNIMRKKRAKNDEQNLEQNENFQNNQHQRLSNHVPSPPQGQQQQQQQYQNNTSPLQFQTQPTQVSNQQNNNFQQNNNNTNNTNNDNSGFVVGSLAQQLALSGLLKR